MSIPRGMLGNAIKRARLDKNLTQEKLAELIGITPMHVKQLESERRNPSVDVLYKLVTTLDLSLDTLFSDNEDKKQEIRNKILLSLGHCSVREMEVAYATIEAMRKATISDNN